jgi:hypothetical protein
VEFIPGDNSTELEPCLEIKSYRIQRKGTKQEVFNKRLCGSNIFRPSNPGMGSCDSKLFSPRNTALVSISFLFVGVSFLLACFGLRSERSLGQNLCTSMMVFVTFLCTLVVGAFIPVIMGVDQFTASSTGVVGLLQALTAATFLAAWVLDAPSPDVPRDN